MNGENFKYNLVYETRSPEICKNIAYSEVFEVLINLPMNKPIKFNKLKTKIKKEAKKTRDEIYPYYKDYDFRYNFDKIFDYIAEEVELKEIEGILDFKKKTFTRSKQEYRIIKEDIPKEKAGIKAKSETDKRIAIDGLIKQLNKIIDERFDGELSGFIEVWDFYERNKDIIQILKKLAKLKAPELKTYIIQFLNINYGCEVLDFEIEILKLISKLDDVSFISITELIEKFFNRVYDEDLTIYFEQDYHEELLEIILEIGKEKDTDKFLIGILEMINENCTYESYQLEWSIKGSKSLSTKIGKLVIDEMIKRKNSIFNEVLVKTTYGSIEVLMHKAVIALGEIDFKQNIPFLIRLVWKTVPQIYSFRAEWADEDIRKVNSAGLAKEAEIILTRMKINDYQPYLEEIIDGIYSEKCVVHGYQPDIEIIENIIDAVKQIKQEKYVVSLLQALLKKDLNSELEENVERVLEYLQ